MNKITETAPERIWLYEKYWTMSGHTEVAWSDKEGAGVAYVRADLLDVELKRVSACKQLIAGLEHSSTWMRNKITELEKALKLRGNEEVNKQRNTNEALTNELEAANALIAELQSKLLDARLGVGRQRIEPQVEG